MFIIYLYVLSTKRVEQNTRRRYVFRVFLENSNQDGGRLLLCLNTDNGIYIPLSVILTTSTSSGHPDEYSPHRTLKCRVGGGREKG